MGEPQAERKPGLLKEMEICVKRVSSAKTWWRCMLFGQCDDWCVGICVGRVLFCYKLLMSKSSTLHKNLNLSCIKFHQSSNIDSANLVVKHVNYCNAFFARSCIRACTLYSTLWRSKKLICPEGGGAPHTRGRTHSHLWLSDLNLSCFKISQIFKYFQY